MEEIKVHVHTIDGVPATKYGEWPGITSSHWKSSLKILRPIRKEKIFEGQKFFKIRLRASNRRKKTFSI